MGSGAKQEEAGSGAVEILEVPADALPFAKGCHQCVNEEEDRRDEAQQIQEVLALLSTELEEDLEAFFGAEVEKLSDGVQPTPCRCPPAQSLVQIDHAWEVLSGILEFHYIQTQSLERCAKLG